jgi:hypothetical protein
VIQYNYSVLKTGNLFQVPDYRGLFVRGLDYKQTPGEIRTLIDPDGERNLDGTVQNDEFKSHRHPVPIAQGITGSSSGAAAFVGGNYNPNPDNTSFTGGAETRPKNIVALYCIKW